jgi:thioredoxin 1
VYGTDEKLNSIIENNKAVVVKFSTSWCGPCKAMEPMIDKLSHEFNGKVAIMSIDAEDEPELAAQYRIKSVPTILYFKNGELIDKTIGTLSEDDLVKHINNLI